MSARLPDSGLTHPCSSRRLLLGAEDLCLPAFVSALYDSLVVGLLSSCLHWLNALLPGQGGGCSPEATAKYQALFWSLLVMLLLRLGLDLALGYQALHKQW